jgi:hypothetical protein
LYFDPLAAKAKMHVNHFVCLALFPLIAAQETILGIYIFHRHGDRSTKSYPPTHLTDLGYAEVFQSGSFYRSRYIDSNATNPIFGISSDLVKGSQLSVQSPTDDVLQNSATGFLQGLYPPVGASLGSETIGNGSVIQSPLGGYQLIPVSVLAPTSPVSQPGDSVWLEGTSGCQNAIVSSNNYFLSQDFQNLANNTSAFYKTILPVINTTFTAATDIYKNAYASKHPTSSLRFATNNLVWDYIQVSMIHNTTIQSSGLLTPSNILQLQTLSDHHEFNLAYNASDTVRAIDGAVLAAQVVQALNATITGKSTPSINVQLGEYANFLSFFGLAQLPAASVNFTGINNFASSMVFELVTNSTVNTTSYPSTDDISVRFLFANGTAGQAPLNTYALFGQSQTEVSWSSFVDEMGKFAIGSQDAWCAVCGAGSTACNTTTSASSGSSSASPTASSTSGGGGISRAVDGVIGAMVTLAVILALIALLLLVGGFRLVKKAASTANDGGVVGSSGNKAGLPA